LVESAIVVCSLCGRESKADKAALTCYHVIHQDS
jgi:hypothetical protein